MRVISETRVHEWLHRTEFSKNKNFHKEMIQIKGNI